MWQEILSYSSYIICCILFFFIGAFVERILYIIQEIKCPRFTDTSKSSPSENENLYHIEKLKNALLSYALNTIKHADPDFNPATDFRLDYGNFDGTTLPIFSGCNIENACFTYINDNKQPISQMEEKQIAIRKYLMKNLNSEVQIVEFFRKFVDIKNKLDDETHDVESTQL